MRLVYEGVLERPKSLDPHDEWEPVELTLFASSKFGDDQDRPLKKSDGSWTYFADSFGLEVAGTTEPVPGIPPTARHLADLVSIAKSRHVRLLVQEPYFSDDAARFLQREAGVRAVGASPSCDDPAAGSYLAHFTNVMKQIAGAISKT